MKALTVQQPWAWAIVHGGKDVENRTQAWSHRGPLAIHAGVRVSQRGVDHELLRPEWATGRGHVYVDRHGTAQLSYPTSTPVHSTPNRLAAVMPIGALVGVVDLVGAHVAEDGCCESQWGEREYGGGRPDFDRTRRRDIVHLELEHPRALAEPVPCRGALGLWTLPPDVRDQVLTQLLEVSA